ncbi:hypothetical protein ACFIJ5_03755 [Haloimpatiens sp. FM7330]|uniref:hypothetical protein n=1 Tax=Haloimpatiens sp. FM7330 TaxID=3298610 RepID=UPI003628E07E
MMNNSGVKSKSKKSHNRLIIDIFINKKAISENNSIFYDDIDLSIPHGEKKYLLENLIKDDFVIVKDDDSMWFNKEKWDKTVNKLSNTYLFILMAPLIVTVIIFLIIEKFF